MRLVTYCDSQESERIGLHVGALGNGQVIDFRSALEWLTTAPDYGRTTKFAVPLTNMISFIAGQKEYVPAAQQILAAHQNGKLPRDFVLAENDIHLISPIPRPTSMRDGYAFRQHVEAARRNRGLPMIEEFDRFPIFYFTNHLAVTGPGKVYVQKLARDKLDFELEVAVVVGKEGRNIQAAQADDYIFGYMIMNDWSARTLQMEEMKLNLGPAKGKDFATSLGPYLVTRDELAKFRVPGPQGERYDLRMQCFVNGKQVSDGNLKDMSFSFGQILERVSYGVTVQPGEVIGSGTVGTGCFLELNGSKITHNQWLQPGDQVILEVDQLGKLENTIAAAD
jgi:fumarylacetoacetate (FAA) hydrolase